MIDIPFHIPNFPENIDIDNKWQFMFGDYLKRKIKSI